MYEPNLGSPEERELEEQELQRLRANHYTARSPKWKDWLLGLAIILGVVFMIWLVGVTFPNE